jgi:hypothetical protein
MTDEADGQLEAEWAAAQAEWAAAQAEALALLRSVLSELPDRPMPRRALTTACRRIRTVMAEPDWPRDLLAACGGVDPARLPDDNGELWLTLASGIVAPRDELPGADPADDEFSDIDPGLADLSDDQQALVALGTLDLGDWLAVASALARGGPGTAASPEALAKYVSEFDPDDPDDQADAAARMFARAAGLWDVLGAIKDGRLTPLGWWGIPDAVQRAWAPRPGRGIPT